mgnify:CR=1 FL=1
MREPELQVVRVEGCTLTSPSQILGVISSRESDLSFTRLLTRYFYENMRRNPATPKPILRSLGDIQQDRQDELRYYNSKTAQSDSIAILEFLTQNGFHRGEVRTLFARDTKSRKNVLTFFITEGPQAVIDSIGFFGLDNLAPEIKQTVLDAYTIERGKPYSEGGIDAELTKMVLVMRNSGYYKAKVARNPAVFFSDDGLRDTVFVLFEPDTRVKIGKIILLNDENGYRAVDTSTRIRQLEIEVGQWYSQERISVSRANLMSLNTFEAVAIDTVARDSTPASVGDSTVWLTVYTRNAKPYDVGANVFVYQTAIDNFVNAGIGATAQYRNLFGVADVASVSTQYVLQDVSRLFQAQTVENESQVSVSYAVPHWYRIDDWGWRIGAQGTTYYSKRNLVSTFKLESFGLSGKLPISLYTYNIINSIEPSASIERQIPLDYKDAYDEALEEANTQRDRQNIISTFNTFRALDDYLNIEKGFLTGIFLGLAFRGEHRDNPVDPRNGYFSSLSFEYGTGAGKFLRTQAYNVTITSLTPQIVAATKFNLAHIFLFAFERFSSTKQNVYVPLERQLFAGGATSIRSYASRQLHDTGSGIIKFDDPELTSIQNNIVGSGTLFELGFELRYSFTRPLSVGDLLGSLIEKSGITWFVDFGNAFNRLTTELYGKFKLQDLFTNSVLATGLGYRFATPVGPFRIDLATSIFDPSKTHPFIVNRPNALGFKNLQLSIGLGHAF